MVLGAMTMTVLSVGAARGEIGKPDPVRGEDLARRWCAGCHVIDGARGGTDAAPTFRSIARDPRKDPDYLRGFLANPHPPMAPVPLAGREIEDLIAYLRQLSDHP
ncbi:MAG TPA: hypothetical protein VKS60_13045 [Stellaceae bacterium]|nr:hypothetical protein [Stellaceae bacterium]